MPLYQIRYKDLQGEDHSVDVEEENDDYADGTAYGLTDKHPYEVYRKVIGPKHGIERWEFAFDIYTSTSNRFKLVDGFYVRTRRR